MIDARKFSRPVIKGDSHPHFPFGGDQWQTAAELRAFAAKVEAGDVAVITVQTGSVVKQDDFVSHGLFIEYAEKAEA